MDRYDIFQVDLMSMYDGRFVMLPDATFICCCSDKETADILVKIFSSGNEFPIHTTWIKKAA